MRLPAAAGPNSLKTTFRMARAVATAIALAAVLSCSSDELPDDVEKNVPLVNSDGLAVHLFRRGVETFPCCQVAPGASREVLVRYNPGVGGGLYTFDAGRNGSIIRTVYCNMERTSTVRFHNGELACES